LQVLKAYKTQFSIPPQDWMTDSKTSAVMAALGEAALFVGGCVRNAVLGEEVGDIDIATQHTPDEVMKRLEAANIKAVPTGIDHGTVTAVAEGTPFEITTLRKDVETDGRRAVVAYTKDWREDAERRDFTMNTLLADQEGNVYDPLGKGLEDLQARRVVFVGEAAERIAEDHLRILRFFRFYALYGKDAPDAAALAACRAAADKIAALSKERITQEFFKILSVAEPHKILELMFANDVLKSFEFKEYDPEFMRHLCTFQDRFGLAFIAPRLLVLAGLKESNVKAFDQFLLIPKVFKKDMQAISAILALPDLSNDQAVKVAVYTFGRVPTAQALMIELANDRVMNGYAPEAIKIIQKWDIPDFPVRGEDLMTQGFTQGPELGAKLAELEEAWIARGFKH
jgi:poly(A) polymerase